MTTFTGQVAQSTDDGVQTYSSGAVSVTGTTITTDITTSPSAFRIENVTIASGATISAATLSLYFTGTKTATNFTIYGNNVANPSTLSTTTSYISNLSQTSQSTSWSTTITNGQFNSSPDISAIATALIGLGSWASGNAMLFIMSGTETATLASFWETYDNTPSHAPEISITYTAGSVPGAPSISLANDATNPTTAIDITITAGTGSPTSYVVQRSTTGLAGTYTTLASGVTSPYTDSSLTPATEYCYQVAGTNGSGTGSYCSPVATATEPAAPTSLAATPFNSTGIALAFTSPTLGSNIALGTNNYAFRWEQPVGSGSWTSGTASSNPFSFSGFTVNSQFGVEVAAIIKSTNGDWSGTIQGPWSSELSVTLVVGTSQCAAEFCASVELLTVEPVGADVHLVEARGSGRLLGQH